MTSIHGPQPMPVADAIRAPGRVMLFPKYNPKDIDGPLVLPGEHMMASRKFWDTELSTYKRVRVEHCPPYEEFAISAGTLAKEIEDRVSESFGPQRLPFEDMWFEGTPWCMPAAKEAGGRNLAVRVRARQLPGDDGSVNTFTLFFLGREGHIQQPPMVMAVFVNRDGTVGRFSATGTAGDGQRVERLPAGALADMTATTLPVMWAIGLMNCRNVAMKEVVPQPRTTRKQHRPRPAGCSYHTIVLPSPRHSGAVGTTSDHRGEVAQHTVRGHFATYKPEAPLFGKLVGTYWRPWHLSGNPDRGVIESDYRLDA